MNQVQYDSRFFAELYDVQPQAIVWMKPVWSTDGASIIDFEFVYSNEEGLKYLNLSREDFQGLRLSLSPTLNEDLRKRFMAEMVHVYQSGEPSKSDIYNPVLNKYARVMRTRLRDGILTVVQDRTEENRIIKRLEEQAIELKDKTRQLQEREKLLDNLLRFSPAAISITQVIRDESGKIVDGKTILANAASEQFLMIPREIYLSKTVSEIDPAILSSPIYQKSIKTLETGEPFNTQYFFAPSDRWIELSVSKMDQDHLINIFLDISETKTAQIQLEQAADRLQAVFNSAQSGMFTFAPEWDGAGNLVDFRFVITNPSFAAYVGQTPEGLRGALGSTFFPGYLHNGVFEMYRQTYLTGETLRKDVHYHVDGHDLFLDLMSTKVHDEVLVTFTDYTALKKTQLQLEKLVDDLRRSNTNLEEFAHAASHDLKEPIRKIRVFADRLKSSLAGRLNEGEKSMFDRMQNATERMTLLVDDLLTYSHISSTPREMEYVDLNRKLQLALTDLEVMIEEKHATVSSEKLPTIKGYSRQISQLFQNLISNALKYSKPDVAPQIVFKYNKVSGAEVAIELPTELHDRIFYLIEVSDNGIGFEQQYADRIFQMFQRLHGRSEYSGTGIGLSIARKVVDNHQGYIWAEGTPGVGATFKVLFPA